MPRILTRARIRRWWPERKPDAHKGQLGRIYVLAGSRGMAGAAVLCSMGAVKSGAGLVRLGTVRSRWKTAASRAPLEVMTEGLPESRAGFFSARAWAVFQKSIRTFQPDVIAAGPGFGREKGSRRLVGKLLATSLPVVLDADGLRFLAGKPSFKRTGPLILTPHPGELAGLFKTSVPTIQANRERFVREAARRWSCVCVLKGKGTLVSDGKSTWKNPTGNPGMASGGTGDVLTGLIAGLWGQTGRRTDPSGLRAACLGVYVHGAAGDKAARRLSQNFMTATDLVQYLPSAIKSLSERGRSPASNAQGR